MFWIVFIYGVLLGSFYNVVGYRLPHDMSIVKPGSFCPKCNHSLKWYELIPVFSYLIQKGNCRKCKSHISFIYPFIELLTGLLFALSYYKFGFNIEFFISILIASFLIIVIVSDINYLIIPDEATIFFSVAIIIANLVAGKSLFFLLDGIIMFVVMYLVMFFAGKVFKEEALGGGDVKLMFFIGIVLGIQNSLLAIFLGSLLSFPAALFGTFSKKFRHIPFGPFLLGATFIIYYFDLDLIELLNLII